LSVLVTQSQKLFQFVGLVIVAVVI